MTFQIKFRLPLFESVCLTDRDRGYLKGIHPLADGTAVVHLSTYQEDEFETSLIHVGNGIRRRLPVPAAVRDCISRCREDEVTESASYGAPVSFQVDERVGLLVTDRWAWLFDPRGDAEPVAIEIAPSPGGVHPRQTQLYPSACRRQPRWPGPDHPAPPGRPS